MSVWTDTVGAINYENISGDKIAGKDLGEMVSYEEVHLGKSTKLPMGSEGSLQYKIEDNTVTFFGGCRDVDELDDHIEYFENLLKDARVWDASITLYNIYEMAQISFHNAFGITITRKKFKR